MQNNKFTSCKLYLGDEVLTEVASPETLVEAFKRYRKEINKFNPIIGIEHENQNYLAVGLSKKGCFLMFYDSLLQVSYSSINEQKHMEQTKHVHFDGSGKGHISEIPLENIVTFTTAMKTAKAFFVSGIRPQGIIEWQMD
jgi:hypothetical protein